MRIGNITDILGSRCNEPLHTLNNRIRHPWRPRGGVALCQMLQRAIRGLDLTKYLSSYHDPMYRFHHCQASLRVLAITEIKTVPYVPHSHPLSRATDRDDSARVSRLDPVRDTTDRDTKLLGSQRYYNGYRTHAGLEGRLPKPTLE